jgi:hypothetical protein
MQSQSFHCISKHIPENILRSHQLYHKDKIRISQSKGRTRGFKPLSFVHICQCNGSWLVLDLGRLHRRCCSLHRTFVRYAYHIRIFRTFCTVFHFRDNSPVDKYKSPAPVSHRYHCLCQTASNQADSYQLKPNIPYSTQTPSLNYISIHILAPLEQKVHLRRQR